ncbi:unnamed protein product [Mytilus coruscus]|uniref:Uncharacterized protein n=1 Tax=Mytilus coruscus TaxID=42192 RepID=A0A6J8E5L3_MYTCO|nr:unnamed protein product [Mytilus coruscus]
MFIGNKLIEELVIEFYSLLQKNILLLYDMHYLVDIPKEISMDERKTYMEAIKSGTEVRQYVRIQVIGKDRVGKTSLVRRLLGYSKHDGRSTDGIYIEKTCQIRTRDGKWIVNKGEPERRKRINRILQAINGKENPQSPTYEKHQFTENLSNAAHHFLDTKGEQNEPLQCNKKQKEKQTIATEPLTPQINENIQNIKNISAASSKNSEDKTLNVADSVDSSREKNSLEKHKKTDIQDSEQNKDQKISEKPEVIFKAMKENMNEILLSVKNQKGQMTSDDLVECGIWDFAGQRDYYATHQTFFTPHAIYIIVADIEDDIQVIGEDCNFDAIGG